MHVVVEMQILAVLGWCVESNRAEQAGRYDGNRALGAVSRIKASSFGYADIQKVFPTHRRYVYLATNLFFTFIFVSVRENYALGD